ncbi:hypothetical protein LguiB_032408 [Lonicera macranthoides]
MWKSHFLVAHATLLLSLLILLLQKASCSNETDHLSLLAIKAQITSDTMQQWNQSLHFCQWKGVSCGKRHKTRVVGLNFESWNLVGTLSPSIGNLSFLKTLQLSNNIFRGEIPHEIGQLLRLRSMALTNNSFVGKIPAEISFCSRLRILDLNNNKFTEELPVELGSLSLLFQLAVESNELKGTIPPSFGNLSSLEDLRLTENMLEGSIPDSLGQLKHLKYLTLSLNQLSGTIPPSIFNLSSIINISLASNQLEGNLPRDLGFLLPNLGRLNIWGNKLAGSIPISLSNASNLASLDLSINGFSGGMPIDFGNAPKLYWLGMIENNLGSDGGGDLHFISSLANCSLLTILSLDRNNFGEALPNTIANLSTKLHRFSIGGNQLSGVIPTGIGNLVSLTTLNMHYNQLTGSIPTSIGSLNKLQEVGFGENRLSGEIPFSIGNLTLLNQLWLEENNFHGNIPPSLGKCKSLFLLHLYGNNLSGSIPREVISLPSLSKSLNLAQNHLTGSLPLEVGNLINLVELNISHNELSGEIPSTLGSCIMLGHLYMDHNSFGGAIPPSLKSLKGIQELDLSHNSLSGRIPSFLATNLVLQNLDLSFNNLEGEVPKGGVFENASALSVTGNGKLCGGIPPLNLPICSPKQTKNKRRSSSLKLLLPLVVGIIGIALISLFLIFGWFIKRRKHTALTFSPVENFLNISYGQLLKATNSFSSANLVGLGSFGSVYKGILDGPNDLKFVAVKVLNLNNRRASKSFIAECEALRNIRHRNLVKILTVCSSTDYNGNDFKALVYEYMENGSLDTWLYPNPQLDQEDVHEEPKTSLNLLQRLNVAIDVASALDYLHNHCPTPIVHCDLKPRNILLDGEMTARVSDFGLARFLKQPSDEISQNQSSSTGIKGTIGYAAPEYGMGSEVSKYGDVYSYGILLLEMFTGKRPTDAMFNDNLNLHKLAKEKALLEQVMEFADQIMLFREEGGDETNSSKFRTQTTREDIQKGLVSILKIGVACSKEAPRERMEIFDAAMELKSIKDMLYENWIPN